MTNKPLIIYIEDDYGTEPYNNFRDALIAVLEKDCDCTVANYPYIERLRDDETKVKQAIRYGSVILFIVAQERYDDIPGHEHAITYFRTIAPATLPIVVVPNELGNAVKIDPADPTIKAMQHHDHEWIEFVKYLRAEWARNADWLRADNATERQTIADQLVDAHCTNNPEETALGPTDDNERTVAEALRVRLLGSALASIEFDNTLDRLKPNFPTIEESVYRSELERFRRLPENELTELDRFLQDSVGAGEEGRGRCEPNVCGFAIDPVTQETNITRGSGKHRLAAQILAQRLESIGMIRRERLADEQRYEWRLIQGRIIREVPGFSVPILVLYQEDAEDEIFKRTGVFLMSKRQFIPVSSYTKLFE